MAFNGNGANGDASGSSESQEKRKIFVGGLSSDTGEDDVRTYFGQFGEVEYVTLKRDPASGRSRGFAFVTFSSVSAVKAVSAVSNHQLKGKKIDPKPAEPKTGEEPCTKIFVGGIDPSLSDEELKSYFDKYGTITNVEWPKDRLRDNAKKNFAFLEFEDDRIVNEIIKIPKQMVAGKMCDVKKALPSQPKTPGAGAVAGRYGDFGNPYGSFGYGGYSGGGGYGDSYASYYGSAGYDQSYYGDSSTSGYYGGYDYGGGYDYTGAGYGTSGYGDGAAGYGAMRGAMRGGMRGRGALGPAAGRGMPRPGGMAGAGARGAPRGFHPYRR